MEVTAPGVTRTVEVREQSQVGDARRQAVALGSAAGLGEEASARLALVATELAQNLVKHARGGGVLHLRALQPGEEGQGGVELLSVDSGPGIPDVARALRDGFSTAGTQGTGFGAVQRQSERFDLYTAASGTVVLARVWGRAGPGRPAGKAPVPGQEPGPELGVVCTPRPGQTHCGDAWAALSLSAEAAGGRAFCLVVSDGLGHGPEAAQASRAVLHAFAAHAHHGPVTVMARAHEACRSTRGAAALACQVGAGGAELIVAGVGNVAGVLLEGPGRRRGLVSQPGTLGVVAPRLQPFTYPLAAASHLVVHSDGLTSSWDLSAHPGLLQRHPAVVAAVLARDFSRGRDDLAVVVVPLDGLRAGGAGGGGGKGEAP